MRERDRVYGLSRDTSNSTDCFRPRTKDSVLEPFKWCLSAEEVVRRETVPHTTDCCPSSCGWAVRLG